MNCKQTKIFIHIIYVCAVLEIWNNVQQNQMLSEDWSKINKYWYSPAFSVIFDYQLHSNNWWWSILEKLLLTDTLQCLHNIYLDYSCEQFIQMVIEWSVIRIFSNISFLKAEFIPFLETVLRLTKLLICTFY